MKMFVAEMQHDPGRQEASLGAMGVDELRWLRPVRPGDTLRARSEVIEKKTSQSRPEMGIVRSRITLFNQKDDPVMTMMPITLFRTRPPQAA
jgi:acyl dehydratase